MYSKLPVSDRLNWLSSYRKAYPNGSYRDAVNHYNSDSKQEFGDGGKLHTNGMLGQGDPTKQDENTDPMWFQHSTMPYRIKDDNKRNDAIKNFYWNLRDEGRTPEQSIKGIKEMNVSYGSDRFDGTRKDYFENYHGFDYNDINNDSLNKWEGEYKLPIKKFTDGGTLPKPYDRIYTDEAKFNRANMHYNDSLNEFNWAKKTENEVRHNNPNVTPINYDENSRDWNLVRNMNGLNNSPNARTVNNPINYLEFRNNGNIEYVPVMKKPIEHPVLQNNRLILSKTPNKPIVKQEQPIPSVKEIIKQPVIPVKPKEEINNSYGTRNVNYQSEPLYWFDRKDGTRQFMNKDEWNQQRMGKAPVKKFDGGGKIYIDDKRKIRATTGLPINPNRDLKSGEYNNDYQIDSIAENATRRGVNPYQAISQGLVETGLGKSDWNIGHNLEFSSPENRYSEFMDSILESQKKARRLGKTSDEDIIQAYNGYGKLTPKTENNYYHKDLSSFYGVPIPKEGLDMNKNPLYGKEVLDIQHNVIEPNKKINNIVRKYQYPRIPQPIRESAYQPVYK